MDDDLTSNGVGYESEVASLSDEDRKEAETLFLNHIHWLKTLRSKSLELPDTVSLIECENGTKVYLIGTAHFSEESINDVKTVMDQTYPDFVVVELCPLRSHSLNMDEEKLKQQLKVVKLGESIKMHGLSSGILQYLLLRLTGYLVDTLGMVPGGEFRAAVRQALKQNHFHIVLGDRPVNVTLYRALEVLGPWRKLKFFIALLLSFQPITKEQIEEMKKSDFLEKIMLDMAGDHPELMQVLVEERDKYLARSIWDVTGMKEYHELEAKEDHAESNDHSDADPGESLVRKRKMNASLGDFSKSNELDGENLLKSDHQFSSEQMIQCCSQWPPTYALPRVVVAVVGIGHVAGIKKHWSTAHNIDKQELMKVLDPPLSWRIFKWTFRFFLVSAVLGFGYGIVRLSVYYGSLLGRLIL